MVLNSYFFHYFQFWRFLSLTTLEPVKLHLRSLTILTPSLVFQWSQISDLVNFKLLLQPLLVSLFHLLSIDTFKTCTTRTSPFIYKFVFTVLIDRHFDDGENLQIIQVPVSTLVNTLVCLTQVHDWEVTDLSRKLSEILESTWRQKRTEVTLINMNKVYYVTKVVNLWYVTYIPSKWVSTRSYFYNRSVNVNAKIPTSVTPLWSRELL